MATPEPALVAPAAAPENLSSLVKEVAAFVEDCEERYRFNSRWDNAVNAGGILLSVAIVAAGVYQAIKTSTILGALVAALVTTQRAFPFGQRAIFYRVLIGKAQNLRDDVTYSSAIKTDAALATLKALRLDFAQQLPAGNSTQQPPESPKA